MNFLILHRFYGTVLNNYRSFQIIRISKYTVNISVHLIIIGDIATKKFLCTVKYLIEDALLFNSRILECASIQDFQNFM